MKQVHLVCNAHLDPVWLWRWDEGLGEALSTFRIAADFCEKYDGFIFNHNEALLYEWIKEYDSVLFKRIKKLVNEGKWHIMGGWYLQPDCNMPSGESFIRQILYGREFFMREFDAMPRTSINFDPFGHSRGLVQIMAKSGYDSYVFCRPDISIKDLPGEDFIWKGFDGSEILAHRSYRFYLSQKGKAVSKIAEYMEKYPDRAPGMVLWGIGNHGGGPSEEDLKAIAQLQKNSIDVSYVHSTPENYFDELRKSNFEPGVFEEAIQPFSVGCYTTQIRIKQKHIQLENELYMTEKMVSAAAASGLMDYDKQKLIEAQKDLMFCEFHDILPGTSIETAEEDALRTMDHGLEILDRMKTKAFYMMIKSQPAPKDKVLPIFAYNPHPWPVEDVFECEYMNEFNSTREKYSLPHITSDGKEILCQDEKEASNLNAMDWRKKVVFKGKLKASSITRFDLTLEAFDEKPKPRDEYSSKDFITVSTADMNVKINKTTGMVDAVIVNGRNYVKNNAFRPTVIGDNADAWGMQVDSFRDEVGAFELMNRKEAVDFAAVNLETFEPVRIIENGPVRTVVESYLKYKKSAICINYIIPKKGQSIDVKLRVYWKEPDKMLKLHIPTAFKNSEYWGQVACGTQKLTKEGKENISQKWLAAVEQDGTGTIAVINNCFYGSSFEEDTIKLTLLRSPAYSGHPTGDKPILPDDRYIPRIDMGERKFSFRVCFGTKNEVLEGIDRRALEFNERPMVLTAYTAGEGEKPAQLIEIKGEDVILQAFKKSEDGKAYIARFYNGAEANREIQVISEALGFKTKINIRPFEIKTYRIEKGELTESDLIERRL